MCPGTDSVAESRGVVRWISGKVGGDGGDE